jgi:hypothetical protein
MEATAIINLEEERMLARRRSIRDGDVGAVHRKGLFSAAIRMRTFSRVSHVLYFVTVRGILCALQAQEGRGVEVIPFSTLIEDSTVQVTLYALKDRFQLSRLKILTHAFSHWGCRYAPPWQFIRSFLTKELCDYFGFARNVDAKRFFCSQFVLDSLRAAGYEGNPDLDPVTTSPGDILELDCLERVGRVA